MPSTRARAVWGALLLVLPLVLGSPGAGLPQSRRPPLTIQQEGAGEVSVIADQIQQVGGPPNLLIAVGNVEIVRGATRLLADRVELNRDTGEAVAQGKVVFYDGQDRLMGDRVDYNTKTGTGVVYNANAFSSPYYSLSGRRLDRIGESVYEAQDAVFTTCEGANPAWSIRIGSCVADLNDSVSGWDASFWVGNIPLIPWFPWFAAAIRRERQSGFLFPQLGVSNKKGFFARVPYYWAIDDSQDLTVSLDTFTDLGVGASLEYRYILSQESAGQMAGFFVYEAFKDSQMRGVGTFKHTWQVNPGLSVKVNSTVTSDDEVFRQYGDRLGERSTQRAETNVFVSKRWDTWNLVGNVLWYQDLTTTRPVELQRVPEIRLDGLRQPIPGLPGLLYETRASFTNFIRDVGASGVRADLHPRAFYPLPVGSYFTVTPFAGGRATYYDKRVVGTRLTRAGGFEVEETVDDPHVRVQAEGGLDLETRLARVWAVDGTWGLSALQHVIEPRATWTEIRGLNQKNNPQYDPAIDDIGKKSEVTYSITQRLNAKTVAGPYQEPVRWEAARFVVSQTYNLLPAADQPFKDLQAELIVWPNEILGFRGNAQWNLYGLGLRAATADVIGTYKDVAATVGTRFNEIIQKGFTTGAATSLNNETNPQYLTANGSIAARITSYLNARVSTEWDVKNGTKVENRFGVDIHFQCWAILLEYIDRHNNEDEFRFSVNLLGLGQTGSRLGTGIR